MPCAVGVGSGLFPGRKSFHEEWEEPHMIAMNLCHEVLIGLCILFEIFGARKIGRGVPKIELLRGF